MIPAEPRPDCIFWTGEIMANGYGRRGNRPAHRMALAEKLGRPIAAGMDACHTCDVRHCVNPEHLYEGTRAQNMADARARGRLARPNTEANKNTRLTDVDVRCIRDTYRARPTLATAQGLAAIFGISVGYVRNLASGHCSRRVAA